MTPDDEPLERLKQLEDAVCRLGVRVAALDRWAYKTTMGLRRLVRVVRVLTVWTVCVAFLLIGVAAYMRG